MLGSESQWLVGSYTFSPDCGQVRPGMPSSRDSFRRNRVAPVGFAILARSQAPGFDRLVPDCFGTSEILVESDSLGFGCRLD